MNFYCKTLKGLKKKLKEIYEADYCKQFIRYRDLYNRFYQRFSIDLVSFASSSGRVELCGNHTDHNGGKVLACSINLDNVSAFCKNNDNLIIIDSKGYSEIRVDLNNLSDFDEGTSKAMIVGVLQGLKDYGYKIGGFNACIDSSVPSGAGVSSSASFELLIIEILNHLFNEGKITASEKAEIAQFSESRFFGKACGLLDQSAISFGGINLFDFSGEKIVARRIKNNLHDLSLVLVDTGGSHADLTDEYVSIPNDMYNVANAFGKKRLCEIDYETFNRDKLKLNDLTERQVRRAEHFFEENIRVLDCEKSIEQGDLNGFINCLNSSGESSLYKLENCFVKGDSDPAIPKAISTCKNILNDIACRVHGGGFAGCVLVVVKTSKLNSFISKLKCFYNKDKIIPVSIRENGLIVF